MNQHDFFLLILETLEDLGIPYMVAGSVGAMLHGEPRLTNDLDLVIDLTQDKIPSLVAALATHPLYVTPVEVMKEEVRRRGSFNILHVDSGSKVDMIMRRETAHGREEFSRRRPEPFAEGFDCISATPEDIILGKLRYYREGRSRKHIEDIAGMIRVSGADLDMDYLWNWASQIGLEDQLTESIEFAEDS